MKLKWGVVCALLVPYGVAIAEVVEDAKELPEVAVSARHRAGERLQGQPVANGDQNQCRAIGNAAVGNGDR